MTMCNSKVVGSVLLVSAEAPMRTVLSALLEAEGHHVHAVDCAPHAYQCLRHPEFDFDAMVATLPSNDASAELYSAFVAAFSPHTSLVFIGAEEGTNPSEFLREGKAVGWLAQPFKNAVLLSSLRVAIEHSIRARGTKA